MSDASIQNGSRTLTCWNKEHAKHVIRQCRWLEVAALISAAVFLLLAAFAFSQTGTFAQTTAAIPFGLFCLTGAGGILLVEMIYKVFLYCKLKPESVKDLLTH